MPSQVLGPFVEEVGRHACAHEGAPRLLLVLANHTGSARTYRPTYVDSLSSCADYGFDYLDAWLATGHDIVPAALARAEGIVVAGGPTPVYRRGLAPAAAAVREAVGRGVPYLGFSAGAMVAAERALLGGWRDDGRAVCDEDWSEGLDELTLGAGLGLVGVTVDVHATQGGLLGRALSVARRGDSDRVVAIDEGTCLSVPLGWRAGDHGQLAGTGFVWLVEQASACATTVRRLPA